MTAEAEPQEPRDPVGAAGVVVGLAVTAGAWLRLRGAATAPYFGDEHHALATAGRPALEILRTFDEFGSHVPLPLLQHGLFEVFGASPLCARLVALIPGLALLLATYPLLRRWVGVVPAALATLVVALDPLHAYYSQLARSYALVGFGGLVLAALARRLVRSERAGLGTAGATALTAGLLGWTHLASGGFVAAIALLAFARARGRRRLVVGATFASAAGLTALLLAPAWPELRAYLESHAGGPSTGPDAGFHALDVATIVAGGRVAAAIFVGALALSLLAWRRRPDAWPWIVAAALGPIVALAVARPVGMAYAWARYLIVAVPFLAVWATWSLRALLAPRIGDRAVLALGTALAALWAITGPLGARWDRHPFSNSYLALRRLPAFDEPWPGASALYAELAADAGVTTIVEAPQLTTRARLLYRHHRGLHGKDVRVGWIGPALPGLTRAYVRVDEDEPIAADVLVFHKDQRAELERYWSFVYDEAWPRHERAADRSFMERHRALWTAFGPLPGIVQRLRDRFGEPFYEDELVVAWRPGAR